MITHDLSEYVRGLQQLLVSDKKRIAFLCCAGTSVSMKNPASITIPSVKKMTELVIKKLCENDDYKSAIEQIEDEIQKYNFNIETFLTNVEVKMHIIGEGNLNGLNQMQFKELYHDIKEEIRKVVSVHKSNWLYPF